MLAASWPESARHLANVTRAPFQATRSWPGSGLAYQLVSAMKEPTSVASLSRNAEPSRSAFVYAKRLLRSSSCAALTTKTAEALPLAVERPVCWTVLFQSRARAGVVARGDQDPVLEAALDEVVLGGHDGRVVGDHEPEHRRREPVVGDQAGAAGGLDVGAGVVADLVARDRVAVGRRAGVDAMLEADAVAVVGDRAVDHGAARAVEADAVAVVLLAVLAVAADGRGAERRADRLAHLHQARARVADEARVRDRDGACRP